MTESRWRTLIEVAETGSIRAAANRLVVTESAVSAAVGSLSRELGVPLLERVGRGIQLTSAGARYAEYLRRVIGLLEEGAAAARGELDPEHGQLRVGCVTTLADRIVPALLGRFRDRYPGVEMRLEVGPSARVWGLFGDHRVDVVIAGRPPERQDVRVRAECANQLLVVGAPGPVADFDPLVTTWLLREPGSGTRATTETLRADLGITGPTMTLGSNGAVVSGAIAGLGVTLAARHAVEAAMDDGRLAALDLPGLPLSRPWYLSTRPTPSRTASLFTGFLLADVDAAPDAGAGRWTVASRPPAAKTAPPGPLGGQAAGGGERPA
jgi:DNA-binding transcriptional LysR family regulator